MSSAYVNLRTGNSIEALQHNNVITVYQAQAVLIIKSERNRQIHTDSKSKKDME